MLIATSPATAIRPWHRLTVYQHKYVAPWGLADFDPRFGSCDWRISILAVPSGVHCNTYRLLCLFIVDIHVSVNFSSIIPIDDICMNSYCEKPLLLLLSEPVWVAVNKLNLVPERIGSGLISMFWNAWGHALFFQFLQFLATFAGNLEDYSVLFFPIYSVVRSLRC